ncbi:hypothetical protein BGHDH14_bgh05311 [Blumeria hordei DH14]|uniref:Uncharacterized protein n=1 Tax=Blumeria graminis f. sp. hordei (strain DH14) TaxID=546991 RepID=N1J8U3_BLUG1|nr:hypothetical protein BGHDH14_bgh05311 [Blumeria hordei DH14]
MAPDKLQIRIQSLFQVPVSQPRSSSQLLVHLIGRPEKGTSIASPKSNNIDHDTNQYPIRDLGKIAKDLLLTLASPSKHHSSSKSTIERSKNNKALSSKDMAPCFELPKLKPVNISLTDGTDIPPPPDSPVQDTPPVYDQPPKLSESKAILRCDNRAPNRHHDQDTDGDSGYQASQIVTSPKHPSSIRKFISRRSLNANYANDSYDSLTRPDSSTSYMSGNTTFSSSKRRALTWFGRFGNSGSNTRKSTNLAVPDTLPIKPPPPPPPMLPKLSHFTMTMSDSSLDGAEMFKNIK